jgi:ABC-type Fe3+ transport system substrate-binding protein
VKSSPHPNATKVFVNWLLSKEGQEVYGKAMGQATRRLDVDTRWLTEHGTRASKDFLTVEENNRLENYGEDTVTVIWTKATAIANRSVAPTCMKAVIRRARGPADRSGMEILIFLI